MSCWTAGRARLLINDPDRDKATQLEITAWEPDGTTPTSAKISYAPVKFGCTETDPADIRNQIVRQGSALPFGNITATVLAIEVQTKTHPARIIWEVKRPK